MILAVATVIVRESVHMPSLVSRRVAQLVLAGLLIPPALHAEAWRSVRSAPVGLSSVVVEPSRHRLFVYGAWDQGGQFRDLWSLSLDSLAKWQRVSLIGAGPSPRTNSVLLADPTHEQIVAYGGREPSGPFTLSPGSYGDVWAIDLSGRPTWQPLDVVNGPGTYGPSYGSTGSAAFDARHGRLLAFGGVVSRNIMFRTSGTWQLDVAAPSSWAELSSSSVPSERAYAASAYDTVTDRLVVTGGTVAGDTWMTDSWTRTFPGGAWQLLPNLGAAPPVANRELSWVRESARKLDILNGSTLYSLDLSRTDVAAWSSQPIVDESGVQRGSMAWDESTQSVWAIDPSTANLWRLTLNGSPGWGLAMRAPVQPTALYGSSIVFDPASDRTWMLFGYDSRTFSLAMSGLQARGSRLDDWSAFSVAPPPRTNASVVLDDAHRRLLVFGGASDSTYLGDLWEYRIDTQTWAPISTAGGPSPRDAHSAVIDPVSHRMIVFGGETSAPGGGSQALSDMWALSLDGTPAWTRLEDAPVQRRAHSAIWDAPRGRMIVVSGISASADRDNGDVWEWVPGRTPSWRQGPSTRYPLYGGTEVIHDEQHGVLIMIGVNDPLFGALRVQPLDLATLEWNGSISDETTPPQSGPTYYDPVRRQGVMIQNATAWMLPLGLPSDPQTSLLSAEGSQGQAVIEWRVVGDPQPLRVRRFRDGGGRADRTFEGVVPNAGDIVRLVDTDVVPGDSLDYSLEADVDGAVRQFGVADIRVDSVTAVPPPPSRAFALAVHPISPALSRQAQVRCSLPDAAPARIEALDITGRRVVEMEVGFRGPGEFTVTLEHRFNAGIYFVRLERAGAVRVARLIVLP